MKQFIAQLQSVARYSPSRAFEMDAPKNDKESAKDYEKRVWRERCHVDQNEVVFIPPTSFKESITSAARYLGVQIPGKGKATYTKHFTAGIVIADGISLGITKKKVLGEWLYLNSDGKKGGGKRVWKCMPFIESWKSDLAIHVLDDVITEEVLRYHIEQAGVFIGVGRFRPQNGGYYGRYRLVDLVEIIG